MLFINRLIKQKFKTTILIIFTKKPIKIHLNKKKSSAGLRWICAGPSAGPPENVCAALCAPIPGVNRNNKNVKL